MHEASGWVAEQVGKAEPGRTLVVCRSRATASLVRRWLATEGGRLGVEVALPSSVAAALVPRPLLASAAEIATEDPTLPLDTEMGRRIAGRPGLTSAARRWVQHVRLARAAGVTVQVPAWIEELLDRGWANEPEHAEIVELLGSGQMAAASWDRVVAVGCWEEPGVSSPAEDGILRALCGRLPGPPEELADPLPSVRVPDVTAEARLAVREALRDPEGTLVLCAHVATARRLRDALARNGLPCAWRDTEALGAHDVASAVRRAAGWFVEGPDPALQAEDLSFVLARLGLGRPHPAVAASLATRLGAAGLAEVPLTRARLEEVVLHARLLDAPLSAWLARLEDLGNGVRSIDRPEPLAKLRAAAMAVRARLLVLRAAITATSLVRVLEQDGGAPVAFDPDDFDLMIAQLLGDDAVRGVFPAGNTLGALHRFLIDMRVRVHDDPVAQAILGSLGRRATWPAGPAWVHQALGGSHDPGVLGEGVDVMLADEWDGRPCRTLLLLDVHDHGLGRHARPDPLLTDAEMARCGALPVGRQVERRLAQVRRAAACAGRTLAVVSDRDASGREVVPPVLLSLRSSSERVGSYGLGLDLPETWALRALEVDGGPAAPPEHADWEVRHLAIQASAEWVREGRGPATHVVQAPSSIRPTLAEHLRAESPIAPPWILPYVGDAAGVEEAALRTDKPLSVTGYLGHLARCGFRAFSTTMLGLSEEEKLTAELDAREIGNAVHAALERAAPALAWRTLDQHGKAAALAELRKATDESFEDVSAKLGRLSPSRRAAGEGLRARWNTHWESYVQSRSLAPNTRGLEDDVLRDHPDFVAASAVFAQRVRGAQDLPWWLVRAWVMQHAGWRSDEVEDPAQLTVADGKAVSCPTDDLLGVLDHPTMVEAGRTLRRLRIPAEIMTGRVVRQVVATELPFGFADEAPAEIDTPEGVAAVHLPEMTLTLGRAPLAVRGRIDRVEWITTDKESGIAITDFKTGQKRTEGRYFRWDLISAREPQLLVYAMVLERAARDGALPESLRMPVAILANDQVWMTRNAAGEGPVESNLELPDTYLPVEIRWISKISTILGELVDHTRDGRWLLRPLKEACPKVSPFAFCPAERACRFRGLPVKDGEDEPTPAEAT